MIRFENPNALLLSLIIPLLIWARYAYYKYHETYLSRAGHRPTLDSMMTIPPNKIKNNYTVVLWVVFWIFMTLAFANPQWSGTIKKQLVAKSDVYLLLDISQSMDAQDVLPSRLERSKKFLEKIIKSQRSNRIGLIIFAGDAFIQMPFTSDMASALSFVKAANTSMISNQGTDIAAAITLALQSTQNEEATHKAMVIISDGEDHETLALDAAEKAAELSWHIITISIGTEKGALIPTIIGGAESYKMDEQGSPIMTTVNKKSMEQIANAAGGLFASLEYNNEDELVRMVSSRIEQLQKKDMEINAYTDYAHGYPYATAIALILGCILWLKYKY